MQTSMAAIGKAAAVAAASVTALMAAYVNLGKSAQEAAKHQGKLEAAFQSVGLSAEQATTTFQGLFRFLGETDRATEAANLLARMTQDEKGLAEWTKILQGVYSTFGDSLPIESLAEAANETAKVGLVTGTLADALNWAGVSEDAFNAQLAATNSEAEREALIRNTLNGLYMNAANIYEQNNQATLNYNQAQANLNAALADAAKYLTPMLTALTNCATVILTYAKPAFEVIAAVVIIFTEWIIAAAEAVAAFFGAFDDSKKATKDVSSSIGSVGTGINNANNGAGALTNSLDKAADAAKELKRQTMGFDELNVVGNPASTSTGTSGGASGGGAGVSIPTIEPITTDALQSLSDFTEKVKEVKEWLEPIFALAVAIGIAFLAWKIVNLASTLEIIHLLISRANKEGAAFFTTVAGKAAQKHLDELKAKAASIGGTIMIVAGAVALVWGYSDAWVNGIDWGNFAAIIAGVAAVVGGLALKFGATYAGVGALGGGIALLILGFKDLIENGASVQNILTIVAGVASALTGAYLILGARQKEVIANLAISAAAWLKEKVQMVAATAAAVAHKVATIAGTVATAAQTAAQTALNFVLNMNPIGLVVTAIAALIAIFALLWNKVDGFREFFMNTFGGLGESIKNIFVGALNMILGFAANVINGFISAINFAIGIINAIPGVEINKINLLEVPKLAKGGITTGATLATIGEAGKEAVLPLENNTEWMDKLAEKIGGRGSAPAKIILKVDGRELGYVAIDSINDITRQTGELPLVIA